MPQKSIKAVGVTTVAKAAIKAVIYDFDGVIVDSRKANEFYYNRLLRHFGLPEIRAEHCEIIQTLTSREVIDVLFPDPALAEAAKDVEKTMANDAIIPLIRREPYIQETLEVLKRRCRTAIATNRGKSLPLVLEFHQLTSYFDLTISSAQVRHHKPHPECLEMILQHFNLATSEALYIGDAQIDARLAEAAGVAFVAYKNPGLQAWAHITDHREIFEVLQWRGQDLRGRGSGRVNQTRRDGSV
jgi:phosphoglycolate phosphatase